MMTETPLFVRTPSQFPMESPAGFVVRLAELNGYDTPRRVFALAGIPRDETFTRRLNVRLIAEALGREVIELRGYELAGLPGRGGVRLCGHSILQRDLGLGHPKICPECILDRGYIPVWVDLTLVDACPVHMRKLVRSCPACGFRLEHLRPGLLRCRCGFDLANLRGIAISPEHGALLEQIVARVESASIDIRFGMPEAQLNSMPLGRLIQMARALSFLHLAAFHQEDTSEAQRAASLFSDWPNNLYGALHAMVPPESTGSGASQVRKHAEGQYRTWLRILSAAPDIAFLRETLAGFPEQNTFKDVGSIVVSNEFTETTPAFKRHRAFKSYAGIRNYRRPEPAQSSFDVRQAAKRVGLPVAVLKYLRRSGHFEVRRKVSATQAFDEADIDFFQGKVAALRIAKAGVGVLTVSLRKALAQKLNYADGKGELVAAVLDGKISVVGKDGCEIGDLLLDAEQTDTFVADARVQAFANSMTGTAAARALACDPTVIPYLMETGHLQGHNCAAGRRVLRDSVAHFQVRYRPIVSIANQRGLRSSVLIKLAKTAGIELLNLPRRHLDSPQPFVRSQDVQELMDAPYETRAAVRSRRKNEALKVPSITFGAAAKALQCTPTVVANLLVEGYLMRHDCNARGRVTQSSVTDFLQHYRSLVSLAKQRSIGSTWFINKASSVGIKLLTFSRGKGCSRQFFIRVEDAGRLFGP